jgi:hypothetical protein
MQLRHAVAGRFMEGRIALLAKVSLFMPRSFSGYHCGVLAMKASLN